jgi:hypothetical protein
MDADREWQLWLTWLGVEKESEESKGPTIYKEAVELVLFRNVWREFAIIHDRAPEQARKDSTFVFWVRWNYARSMGAAIRRQVDSREDVVSLARLIDRVWRYPTVLSRERFVSLYPEDDRDYASGVFDGLAGGGEFINPEIPARDMEDLRARTRKVRRWVNKAVAHTARYGGVKPPPLKEIHEAVDVIYGMFQKYTSLIRAVHVNKGVIMSPWPTIFRVAWIPDDEHEARVAEEGRGVTDE